MKITAQILSRSNGAGRVRLHVEQGAEFDDRTFMMALPLAIAFVAEIERLNAVDEAWQGGHMERFKEIMAAPEAKP